MGSGRQSELMKSTFDEPDTHPSFTSMQKLKLSPARLPFRFRAGDFRDAESIEAGKQGRRIATRSDPSTGSKLGWDNAFKPSSALSSQGRDEKGVRSFGE